MSNSSVIIEVTTIYCINTSESPHDEVYIQYSIDGGKFKRFPEDGYHALEDGETWNNVGLRISYKDNVVIQLYDSDTIGDDLLGSYTYKVSDASEKEVQPYTNTNGANYQVTTEPG